MKGLVFTEFLEMVGTTFSPDMADKVVDKANVASGGAYTSVGFYDYREMVALVVALSELSGVPVPDLIKAFGRYLFGRFVTVFPAFFQGVPNAYDFLTGIETRIHSEVRKLYPDAELPTFICNSSDPKILVLDYRSNRPFADLAEGLIEGCVNHFGGKIDIRRQDRPSDDVQARFTLTRA